MIVRLQLSAHKTVCPEESFRPKVGQGLGGVGSDGFEQSTLSASIRSRLSATVSRSWAAAVPKRL